MSAGQQALVTPANSSGNSNYDPYYSDVSLLLSMNGSNGSTSFPDASQNRLTVTANGNAQISTAQNKFGGSSALFDGTGDYLEIPSNFNVNFGTGDFTVEAWVYFLGTGDYGLLGGNTTGTFDFVFIGNEIRLGRINTAWDYSVPWTRVTNSWVHIAWTRQSGSLRIFVNGVLTGTPQANTISYSAPGATYAVGASKPDTGDRWFNGYIDDLRITKGVARYTATFTPPLYANPRIGPAYDPFYNNVSLLLGMNGSNGSTYFPDNSGSPKTVTANADAKVSTAQWKWGGSSAYFDGTGDYLSIPNSAAFDFGSGDLTVEAWVYIAANSAADIDGLRAATICNAWGTNTVNPTGWTFSVRGDTTTTGIGLAWDTWSSTPGNGTLFRATASISQGTWHHIAATVSGGTRLLFLNGVLLSGSTTTIGSGFTQANTNGNSINIGRSQVTAYLLPLNGYIDDLRITKGVARYTANFTPPAGPFANTGPTVDPYYDYVTLLLPMNGTNASTSFIDSSKTANIISVSGNSQLSTTQWKFGGSSAYFDGTGDFIQYPANTNTNFQSSNFTIEFWAYKLTTASTMTPFSMARNESGTGYGPIRIDFMSNGTVRPLIGNGSNTGWDNTTAGTTVIPINTWTHYAIVKTSTDIKQYINGVLDFTFNTTSGFSDISRGPTIGYNNNTDTQFFNGYIDDFRITKGVARYTGNFTVPTQPNPITGVQYDNYYDNVSLLLNMNGSNGGTSFVDSSPRSKTVTANLNAVTSTAQYKWGVSSAYFDGSGDYLSVAASTDFGFGTDNFTIELWVYFISVPAFKQLLGASALNVAFYSGSAGNLNYFLSSNGTSWDIVNNALMSAVTTNTWYHVALVRNGNVFTPYVNGVAGTTTTSSSPIYSSPVPLYIGGLPTDSTTTISGYVDEVRITKGVARYTANFTPPTQAFPSQGPLTDPFYYNTSLLLHMNGTNGSTVFTDASPTSKNVVPSGNAQISTAQFKWGGSSALLDGTGDYLTTTSATNFQWGTSDYTVECWIRWNTVTNGGIYHFYPGVPVGTTNGTALGYDGTNFQIYALGLTYARAYAVSTGTWYHVATVRSSGSVSLYVNGVKQGASITDNTGYGGNNLHIGLYYSTSFTFNGYIDDFRVTNGVARYRNNFTPPQRQFPDQ